MKSKEILPLEKRFEDTDSYIDNFLEGNTLNKIAVIQQYHKALEEAELDIINLYKQIYEES